jgi:hypothetical protein
MESIYSLTHFKQQIIGGFDFFLPLPLKISSSWKIRYEQRVASGSYTLLDTRLSLNTGEARYFVDVTNLLDAAYQDIPGVKMPGRWLKIGFEYTLTDN